MDELDREFIDAFDLLSEIYTQYTAEIKAFNTKGRSSFADTLTSLIGNGSEFSGLHAHDAFFERVDECTERICLLLGNMRSQGRIEQCSKLSEKAVRFMLFEEWVPANSRESYAYRAVETFAEKLLVFLSSEARKQICAEYHNRFKPSQLLPNQKRIMNFLKS